MTARSSGEWCSTPRWEWIRNEPGERVAVPCGDYFAERWGVVQECILRAAPQELRVNPAKFRVPRFFRTLSSWMNILAAAGLPDATYRGAASNTGL